MGHIDKYSRYLVPSLTLDYLLANRFIDLPDVIKLDVEGAEARVLDGAQFILAKRKTLWIIALHGDEQRGYVLATMEKHAYRVRSLRNAESLNLDVDGADEIWASPEP
jgi:hypothetical protein